MMEMFWIAFFAICICVNGWNSARLTTLHLSKLGKRSALPNDSFHRQTSMVRVQATDEDVPPNLNKNSWKIWFDINTRGGIIVWGLLLLLLPLGGYNILISAGLEGTSAGASVGASFVLLVNLLWASTYFFRVAKEDMTYAKQLRDYENSLLRNRLNELDDDEMAALLEEVERENQSKSQNKSAL